MNMHYGHAKDVVRSALLAEVDSLKAQIEMTEAAQRNIAAIEKQCPLETMSETLLRDYVNLLRRSVKPAAHHQEQRRHG